LEIGIRAVAKSLGIPDPIKPSNRNWHQILKSIKDENDARVARKAKSWKDQRDKEFFVSAYVSLDAVRVAWRNPTMHIENKYTPDEAGNVRLSGCAWVYEETGFSDGRERPTGRLAGTSMRR
jgi:hypothetical protein